MAGSILSALTIVSVVAVLLIAGAVDRLRTRVAELERRAEGRP